MRMRKTGSTVATSLLAGIALLVFNGVAQGDEAEDALIQQGKLIYEETAGGVGCAACHGMAATGDPDAGAPYIRGVSKAQMDSALGGGVPIMEFIELHQQERQAVQAYLAYLTRAEEVMLDPSAAAGKVIFEETAGGVGCGACHGSDATGDIGPDIRGRDSVTILGALKTVDDMGFIELSQEEIAQVSDYLRHLHDTEAH